MIPTTANRRNIRTDEFDFFLTSEFSQWYPSTFTDDKGRTFNCAEQWMMLRKAEFFGDTKTAALIMQAEDPADLKALGRAVQGFNKEKWDLVAPAEVIQGNLMKFSQNPELFAILDGTQDRIIVEAAGYDVIWGIGLNAETAIQTPMAQWPGKNHLGMSLMSVRSILRTTPSLIIKQDWKDQKIFSFYDNRGQRSLRYSAQDMSRHLNVSLAHLYDHLTDLAARQDSVLFPANPFIKVGIRVPSPLLLQQAMDSSYFGAQSRPVTRLQRA